MPTGPAQKATGRRQWRLRAVGHGGGHVQEGRQQQRLTENHHGLHKGTTCPPAHSPRQRIGPPIAKLPLLQALAGVAAAGGGNAHPRAR